MITAILAFAIGFFLGAKYKALIAWFFAFMDKHTE